MEHVHGFSEHFTGIHLNVRVRVYTESVIKIRLKILLAHFSFDNFEASSLKKLPRKATNSHTSHSGWPKKRVLSQIPYNFVVFVVVIAFSIVLSLVLLLLLSTFVHIENFAITSVKILLNWISVQNKKQQTNAKYHDGTISLVFQPLLNHNTYEHTHTEYILLYRSRKQPHHVL